MPEKRNNEDLQRRVQELERENAHLDELNKELQAENVMWKRFAQNSNEIFCFLAGDGTVRYVSPNIKNLSGLTANDFIGRKFMDFIISEDFPIRADQFRKILSGESVVTEERYQLSDGSYIWIRTRGWPVFEDGLVGGAHVVIADITREKMTEEGLTNSEERFRKIVESLPQFIAYVDKDLKYRFVNKTYLEKFNVDAEAILDKPVPEIIGRQAFEKDRPHVERVLRGEQVRHYVHYDQIPGGPFDVDGVFIPDFDETGEVQGYYAVLTDITSHMNMQMELKNREAILNDAQEIAQMGSFVWDIRTDHLDWSRHMFAIAGLDPERFDGKLSEAIDQMIHEEDRESVANQVSEMIAKKRTWPMEFRLVRPDGDVRWLRSRSKFTFEGGGRPAYCVGIHYDVTEQKQADEMLRESEEKYRALYENAPLSYQSLDETGSFLDVNPTWLKTLGYEREEVIGKNFAEFLHPAWKPHFETNFPLFKKRGYVHDVQFKIRRKDGKWLDISFEGCIGYWPDGSFRQTYCVFKDITEQKRSERALRESEVRFAAFMDHLPGFAYIKDEKRRHLFVNKSLEEFFDVSGGAWLGKTFEELLPNADAASVKSNDEQALRKLQPVKFEETLFHEGKQHTFLSFKFPLLLSENSSQIAGISIDITDRKLAEESLVWQQRKISMNHRIAKVFLSEKAEKMYADVLDVLLGELDSRYGYFGYINRDGDLVSPSLTRDVWGECEIEDKSIVFHRTTWTGIWGKSLLKRKTVIANKGLQLPKGHVELESAVAVPILHGGTLIGQFVVANKPGGYDSNDKDLLESAAAQTAPILNAHLENERQKQEQERLEKQLLHAQQMEAIGTLAGGIAHDFNNILSSVIGYTELCLEQTKEGTLLHDNLSEVLIAGMRAKDLIKQILTLSRRDEHEVRPVLLVSIVKEAMKMLRSTVPTSIDFKTRICSEELIVQADATQLHQVIMNLTTNAVHAMADMEGTLEVRVEPVSFGQDVDLAHADMKSGDYGRITIRDTGVGIPEHCKGKIFEPYFTTKEKGQGTGLGLSVVHGIIKSHNGNISVSSESGKGTTFQVYLPLAKSGSRELPKTASGESPGGDEHILVVDDELPIVKMHQQSLESLGYRTSARASSVEAIEAFRASPDKFDLIITDMTMPQMTGDKLAWEIKEIRPDVPIILCTGFSEKINDHSPELRVDGILMKPINKRDMAIKVRELLGKKKRLER